MKCNIKKKLQYNTEEIIKTTSNEFLFGKDFIRKIRNLLDLSNDKANDTFFLTDSIINAQLHTDATKFLMGEFLWRVQSGRVVLSPVVKEEMRSVARDFLCASICHALNSRAKNDVFKEYRANWLEMSKVYRATANERYDNLLRSCGGLYVV